MKQNDETDTKELQALLKAPQFGLDDYSADLATQRRVSEILNAGSDPLTVYDDRPMKDLLFPDSFWR